jgi:16S rRNA (uracil1498-N3)-methyltransferase
MQLFYHPEISETDTTVTFPKEESRHIVKVLRKNSGDTLMVTNGMGLLFTTEITSATPQKCIAKIIEVKKEEPNFYHLHLLVAPTKMNDRYEWFLEKATEIGVQEITPVICSNSERKVIKPERFEKVIQSAMKQSLHYRKPILNEAINYQDLIISNVQGTKFIAHCEEGKERKALKDLIRSGEKYNILIGPEGDFTPQEIDLAIKNDWQPVSLGKSRLRTETAAIVACHTVALINEE